MSTHPPFSIVPCALQLLPPTASRPRTRPSPNLHYRPPQQTPRQGGGWRRRRRRRVGDRDRKGINVIPGISMHVSKAVIETKEKKFCSEEAE